MLHEKPVRYGPPGGDVEGMDMGRKREKRRRKHLTQSSSSSDAPTATSQGHQAPISNVLFGPGKAANDHHGPISDMAIDQEQNHALLPRMEEEDTQELFGPEVTPSMEEEASYVEMLVPNIHPPINLNVMMSWTEKCEVQVRQGRYRIAYYKAVNPESGDKLKHPDAYSDDEIVHQNFFKHLEADERFEWFFHADDSWIPDLNDYQRIALNLSMPGSIQLDYPDAKAYRERYHTYEIDALYVKYYGEMSKKIKWIERFVHLDARSAEWRDMESKGWRQALKIATQLPHMTVCLASFAYNEYIWELREYAPLKDLDLVYFEIWRRVIKDNIEYMDAVREVQAMDKFRMHKRTMDVELKGDPAFWTIKQRIYYIIKKGGISANTEDSEARDLFRKGVAQQKAKNMVNYAEKKMEIAERLNLHKRIEISGQIVVPGPVWKH